MTPEHIRKILEGHEIELSKQAFDILSKLENKDAILKELIIKIKERKFRISGGDMIQYLLRGTISNSLINSGDINGR